MPNLINTMMELRKCCNHPYLITGAEEKILESFKKCHSPDAPDFQLQAMIQAAGKLVLIDKLLPKLLAGGHKVLVFSQMVRCLDILEDYLIQRRYTYERIDGRVRGNLRQAAIDRFCKPDSDRFVFLLCTRAGGLGINLTAADTCIIFDSDWNPQNDLQAQARCHRIGQSKAVKVYRLITRNSYEREMFDKASLKLGLDKAVLQDINRKGSLNGVQQLSKLEVEDLLKKGAYGALMDEEDEGSKFCEEDIDQILQRRTQTITIQSEGKGSTFAKASFISSGNRTDISLDDPNFWQKWAKIAEVEIDSKSEKESLVIDTPRVRKQTRHYNSFEDDELMEFSELDSDSEERPCRTRRLGDRSRRYLRAECFRVEKNLLIFGWGRWKDILNHGRFKWHLAERDMEVICRALLVYCLRHYKGDDKIKSFIWDLITPTKEGQDQALLNHSGLSAPVPRGRKGKKLKNQLNVPGEVKNADWLVNCNPEVVLQDESYKKHLKQHCNKVLLRVRMLYYLKVEVLGEAANQALEGIPASKLEFALPDIDYIEIPATWWDADADKSLLIGVHKHGYERYNAMRADPELCFLERVGMPDVTALTAEQGGGEGAPDMTDSVCKTEAKDDTESKPDAGEDRDENSKGEETCSSTDTSDKPDSTGADSQMSSDLCAQDGTLVTTTTATGTGTGVAALHVVQARPLWPTGPALTARLRRLITAYQRFTLRREPLLRHDFLLHEGLVGMGMGGTGSSHGHHTSGPLAWQLGDELRRCSVVATEPDPLFLEWQRRWTRREQADFYRTVSSFGVVYDPERKTFDCIVVEPLTEERAARTLYRIELLRKIREQVLRHPLLSARLQLCRPSLYLPLPHPHCCLYDSGLGHHSPQPPEYPHQSSHHHQHHHQHHTVPPSAPSPSSSSSSSSHPHLHPPPLDAHDSASQSLGIVAGSRGDFLDCPPLDETLELSSLQHDAISAEALHGGKASKDALNGFPFNSAAGGQSMLNSYGVGGTDLDSKLRSDVLVGEQGSSEETGLMAPSVELDQLQAPWDGTDHSSPAHHMFNESDPILGPSALETGFLEEEDEEAQGGDRGGEEGGTLEECLGLPPPSSPSHPSAGDSVEPLSSSYMLFKDIGVSEEPSADQTDLSASPPPPYVPPPPLSLSDITAHEPQDRLDHPDVTESLANPVDEREDQEGGAGFEFEDKDDEDVEDLSRATMEQTVGTRGDQSLEGDQCDADQGADQSLGDLNPHMNQIDGLESEQDERMDISNQLSQGLQESFDHGEDKTDLPQDVHPYLGKLEQCPESIEEHGEDVDGLILYQTVEEETMEDSIESGALMRNTSRVDGLVEHTDLSDQVDEISEGQVDHVSLMEVPVVPPCDQTAEKAAKQSNAKPGEMELDSIYSECTKHSSGSLSSVSIESKCDETTSRKAAVKTEVSMDQELYEGTAEDSLDQDNKDNLLEQNEIKIAPALPDIKPPGLKFSPLPDSGGEKKPTHLDLPIKVEETKTEIVEDVFPIYPDSSEVKHAKFLAYSIKSEDLVTKAEQLDYPVKQEPLDTKPEDLSLPMKPESLDSKPEALQFAAFSDGAEIKPEAKPVSLGFAAYADGTKLKSETKPEGLRLTAFPDTSAIKPEMKPEGVEFAAYPDSSEIKPETKPEDLEFPALPEIKAEMKQELLEADSTVLTPKLEQVDGLVDTSEGLVVKGQVKEERPSTPVPVVEGYAGSPRFAAPVSVCEIPDSLHDSREPTIAQLLQEKALYSFSEWPKDRVIINRLDSICHAILKGKWPWPSEQHDSPGSLAANSCLANSLAQHHHHRAGFLPTTASSSIPGQARVQQANSGLGFSIPPPLTRLPKERLVAPPFLPELKRTGGRRSFDYEAAAAAAAAAKVLAGKSASSCHTATTTSSSAEKGPVVAPPSHRTSSMLINGWQDTAIDLTKSSSEISTTSGIGTSEAVVAPGISHPSSSTASGHKLPPPPPITAPLPGSVGIDMAGILQAGLIHPVTGQIVNGSLRGDDSLRRRRGRRRNVEALYSEFTKSRGLHLPETQRPAGPPTPSSSSTPTPTQTPPQPEIVAIDREAASKGLIEWLRQNPGYSMDLPAFAHLGGAMAPAIKELSRWLDANSEYYVAPDWADVVKHSGFLPEGKFSRILTEPVNRDPGSRRRGRRPRSEMPKPLLSVSDSSSSGLGPPLFMNGGLIGSMDSMVAMQNLRGGIPGIPISGIMAAGFPHGFPAAVQAGGAGASAEDAKNGLSMLPMMLHGIPHPHGAAIPQHALFSVGAMMAHTPPPPPPHPSSTSSTSSSSSLSAPKVTTTTAPSMSEAVSPSSTTPTEKDTAAATSAASGEKERSREEKGAGESNKRPGGVEAAAIITSSSRAHLGSAHLGASAGSHLTFNPFLIPGMSHGLLYPHMFLPHGGIMALPAMPPGAVDGSPGSPKRRRKRGREEGEREEEREKMATGESEERESTVKATVSSHPASSPSPSTPSTSAPDPGPPPAEEPQTGQGDGEDGPSEPQEPDSHNQPEGAAEEGEERLEETGEEVVARGMEEDEKQDAEEQRQVEGEEETA
ncbi:hypothetical protein INR49_000156 [Caranx melampygus]|nr:hypothetical protein INR49_000156 [Caranx melampygus]